jgi:hypothetical protein
MLHWTGAMTKRRGMYKEYIQILPAADAEAAPPLVTCSEALSGGARTPPLPEAYAAVAAALAPEPPPAAAPPGMALPDDRTDLPPLQLAAARPPAAGESRIALVAATLALSLSAGALTWSLTRTPPQPRDGGATVLTAELSELRGRLAAFDDQTRAGEARTGQLAERLDRTERSQAESIARLGAQLTVFEANLDSRVKAATEAAVAAMLPSPADITASIGVRPSTEPAAPAAPVAAAVPVPAPPMPAPPMPAPSMAAPAKPAPAKPAPSRPAVASGWVLREVSNGVAVVEGRRGSFQVAVGTPLPGLGRVEAIETRGGRQVVVTPRGLIVPARP